MFASRRHQVLASGSTLTASGNSGTLPNLATSGNPTVVGILDCTGVTGTSPSLTVTIYAVPDEGRKIQLAQFTAVTAALSAPLRVVIHDVLEPNLEVDWSVSGTGSPTFSNVSCDLYMTAPDF